MFRFIIILNFLFLTNILTAQETTSSAGQNISLPNLNISFTIGEPVVSAYQLNNTTILSGYQQPNVEIKEVNIKQFEDFKLSIYPNPSSDIVQISWDSNSFNTIEYELLNTNGKLIKTGKGESFLIIDISNYSAGNYFLKIKNGQFINNTYKIQKIK